MHLFNLFVQILSVNHALSIVFADEPKLVPLQKIVELLENSTYVLTCNLFSGAKPIFFEWNKNGQKFSGTTNVRMENTNHYSLLTMTSLTAADSATYECIAKNAYGTASTSTQFVIKGLTEKKIISMKLC
ncbi:hypothetical protein DERF_003785 [Dermatophagoides farinae]|uniref:Ig-like domain-containing protein n=1 Tax=Dermatophagoides farinae TaxID=6954 RepID=A0A922IH00_DERFA|nr:hypothetical protein DERF_003785 [Dermatophagoides farinae]